MRHFFIHGRTPELSIAELLAVLGSEHISYSDGRFLPAASFFSSETALDHLMIRLGGVVKYGEILEGSHDFSSSLSQTLLKLLAERSTSDARITFGFSIYHTTTDSKKSQSKKVSPYKLAGALRDLGLAVKKELKASGFSVRYVAPQSNSLSLSSVVVSKNKLVNDNGIEVVLFLDGNTCTLGITHAVQPFEEYSERDWSRPHRGMSVGLIPPKLAQMMVNLSGKSPADRPALLDPFCGFGTVLQEALLMGFHDVHGSDKFPRMVDATRENISWLMEKKMPDLDLDVAKRVLVADAANLLSTYKKQSLDMIVTEPFLGPIVHAGSDERKIREIQSDLSKLYMDFMRGAREVLKSNGVAVMVWPVWLLGSKKIFLPILESALQLGFSNATIPKELKGVWPTITERNTILYSRVGQNVGREVMVLRKK